MNKVPFSKGYRITQAFGENPAIYAPLKGHNGLDIVPNVWLNNEIYAVDDGVVVVDNDIVRDAYGIKVSIWNKKNNTAIRYGHLASNCVSINQEVKRGDLIGIMGGTGNVFPKPTAENPYAGSHLHLELLAVDNNGVVINRNNGYGGALSNVQAYLGQVNVEIDNFNAYVPPVAPLPDPVVIVQPDPTPVIPIPITVVDNSPAVIEQPEEPAEVVEEVKQPATILDIILAVSEKSVKAIGDKDPNSIEAIKTVHDILNEGIKDTKTMQKNVKESIAKTLTLAGKLKEALKKLKNPVTFLRMIQYTLYILGGMNVIPITVVTGFDKVADTTQIIQSIDPELVNKVFDPHIFDGLYQLAIALVLEPLAQKVEVWWAKVSLKYKIWKEKRNLNQ